VGAGRDSLLLEVVKHALWQSVTAVRECLGKIEWTVRAMQRSPTSTLFIRMLINTADHMFACYDARVHNCVRSDMYACAGVRSYNMIHMLTSITYLVLVA
jgi:hypothetical protein